MQVQTSAVATGFASHASACGLKQSGRPDLALIHAPGGCNVAVVTTRNPFAASSVHVTRQHAASGRVRAVIINSGNANACTGRQGLRDTLEMARATARACGCETEEVLVASTGIIGEPLDMGVLLPAIDQLTSQSGADVPQAILTTDSGPKLARETVTVDGSELEICAMGKGSGMIHPNMATMLAFVTTNANVSPELLQEALQEANTVSFNQISVDACESTNDMAMILASGTGASIDRSHAAWPEFKDKVRTVCQSIARQIAADGEGATRLIQVSVEGAPNDVDARAVARAIVSSNLVKTAIHGKDPNWGRILAAAGQPGVPIDPEIVTLALGPPGEERDPTDDPTMNTVTLSIQLSIGSGPGTGLAWGCDLSAEYVHFNSEYTT